jgi:deazaflavin-dependent oxidoreductase (nitroreductase family)
MTKNLSRSDASLRQVFKYGNRFILLLFRLGLGNFGNGPATSQVMVLVHRGRKSGLRRTTPVNYALLDGDIYCTAGFGAGADWYKNLVANPQVEVWLREGWWAGEAEDVTESHPQALAIMRQVLVASGFAAPLFAGLNPKSASDEALAAATAGYRLVRIRRTEARTGPGGPGDLAWVWPLATLGLLALLGLRARSAASRPPSLFTKS